jgi:Ca2+-binding EF-hand superfamily protein
MDEEERDREEARPAFFRDGLGFDDELDPSGGVRHSFVLPVSGSLDGLPPSMQEALDASEVVHSDTDTDGSSSGSSSDSDSSMRSTRVLGRLPHEVLLRQQKMIQNGPRGKFPTVYGSSKFAIANPDFDYGVVGYFRRHTPQSDVLVPVSEGEGTSAYKFEFTVNNPNTNNDPVNLIAALVATKCAFSASTEFGDVPHLKSAANFGWVDIDVISPMLDKREMKLRVQFGEKYYKHVDDMKGKARGRRRGVRSLTPPGGDLGLGPGGVAGGGRARNSLAISAGAVGSVSGNIMMAQGSGSSVLAGLSGGAALSLRKNLKRSLPHILRFAYKPTPPSEGISWEAQWVGESWRGLEWTENVYRRLALLHAKADQASSEEGMRELAIAGIMEQGSVESIGSLSIPSTINASMVSDASSGRAGKTKRVQHVKYPLIVKQRPGHLAGWTDALTPAISVTDESATMGDRRRYKSTDGAPPPPPSEAMSTEKKTVPPPPPLYKGTTDRRGVLRGSYDPMADMRECDKLGLCNEPYTIYPAAPLPTPDNKKPTESPLRHNLSELSTTRGFGRIELDMRFYSTDSVLHTWSFLNEYLRDLMLEDVIVKGNPISRLGGIGELEEEAALSSSSNKKGPLGEADRLFLIDKQTGEYRLYDFYSIVNLGGNYELCDRMVERLFGYYYMGMEETGEAPTKKGRKPPTKPKFKLAAHETTLGSHITHLNLSNVADRWDKFPSPPKSSALGSGPQTNYCGPSLCNSPQSELTNRFVLPLVSGATNLHVLNVANNRCLTDRDVHLMLEKLVYLTELDVSNCCKLTDDTLRSVAHVKNDDMVSLKASRNGNFTSQGCTEIMLHCTLLQLLDLSFCTKIDFIGMIVRSSNGVLTQYVTRDVRRLYLNGCTGLNYSHLTAHYIVSALGTLTHAELAGVQCVDDQFVFSLLNGAPFLESLDLSGCKLVSDESIKFMGTVAKASGGSGLRQLKLADLTDGQASVQLNEFGNRNGGTKDEMEYSEKRSSLNRVGNTAVTALLSYNTNIAYLDLSFNPAISANAISDVEIQIPNLLTVILDGCDIGSFGLACLAERCPLMESLSLSHHTSLDDSGLFALAGQCKALRYLDVSDCHKLTNRGVGAVVFNAAHLVYLNCSSSVEQTDSVGGRFHQYTDSLLETILTYSRSIRSLYLVNQNGITVTSDALTAETTTIFPIGACLTHLDMFGCEAIKPRALISFVDKLPYLTQMRIPSHKKELKRDDLYWWLFRDKRYQNPRPSFADQDKRLKAPSLRSLYSRSGTNAATDAGTDAGTDDGTMTQIGEGSVASTRATSRGGLGLGGGKAPMLSSDREKMRLRKLEKALARLGPAKGIQGEDGLFSVCNDSLLQTLRFRDHYCQRRLDEDAAARHLQFCFKLYAMWQRFRRGIACRKLEYWWLRMAFEEMRRQKLRGFRRHIGARSIQRCFREWLPMVRAVVCLQRFHRCNAAKRFVRMTRVRRIAATLIQKHVRGMVIRISDMYVLAQVYMKLPLFWKQLIHSMPGAKGAIEHTLSHSHVRGAAPIDDHDMTPAEKRQRAELKAKEEAESQLDKDDVNYVESNLDAGSARYIPSPALPADIEAVMKVGKDRRRGATTDSIADLLGVTRSTIDHIMTKVVSNGVIKPQLVSGHVIPQPFDKEPYVSLSDGRRITFFRHFDSLLEGYKDDRESELAKSAGLGQRVHPFNIQFWPLTKPMEKEDPSTVEHDAMLNNFEVAKNERYHLDCTVCQKRLRVVFCDTCRRGFCFFCAFRQHTVAEKRNHSLRLMEPRIVKYAEASKSLVYHVQESLKCSHDLKYLVKYMRSSTEVQRIAQEKKLQKEMTEQEERRKLAFIAAQNEAGETLDAAVTISLLYRSFKAKKLVNNRRLQNMIEREVERDFTERNNTYCIRIQVLFRQFSTRMWFARHGVKWRTSNQYKPNPKKKKIKANTGFAKKVKQVELRARIEYELRTREINKRNIKLDALVREFVDCVSVIKAHINFWTERWKEAHERELKMEVAIKEITAKHDKLSFRLNDGEMQTAAASSSAFLRKKYKDLDYQVKATHLAMVSLKDRFENHINTQWWINQLMRSSYRRLSVVLHRYEDSLKHITWVYEEATVIGRTAAQLDNRIILAQDGNSNDMKLPIQWMTEASANIHAYYAKLDSLHESLIEEELGRVTRDHTGQIELESLVNELEKALAADGHYYAERVALDCRTMELERGSDKALANSNVSLMLKRKQQLLQGSVIDTLKFGLEQKFDAEDDRLLKIATFAGDDPSYTALQMYTIEGTLIAPFKVHHHCNLMMIYPILMAQPWLVDMAVEDCHLEEKLLEEEITLDTMQKELQRFRLMKEDGEKKVRDTKTKIKELENEITVYSEPISLDENIDEQNERLTTLSIMTGEKVNLEMSLVMTLQMNEQMEASMLPSTAKIQEVTDSIFLKKEKIEYNTKERVRLAEAFFRHEFDWIVPLQDMVSVVQSDVETLIKRQSDRIRVINAFCPPAVWVDSGRLYRPTAALELEDANRPKTHLSALSDGLEGLKGGLSSLAKNIRNNTKDGDSPNGGSTKADSANGGSTKDKRAALSLPGISTDLGEFGPDDSSHGSESGGSGKMTRKSVAPLKRSNLMLAGPKGEALSHADLLKNLAINGANISGTSANMDTDSDDSERPPTAGNGKFANGDEISLTFLDSIAGDGAVLNAKKIIEGDVGALSVYEREACEMPIGNTWVKQHTAHRIISPRQYNDTMDYIFLLSYEKRRAKNLGLDALKHMLATLLKELRAIEGIRSNLKVYQGRVKLLESYMLRQRKQRALQHNIDMRARRIEQFRDARLRAMLENKQKEEEEFAFKAEVKRQKKERQMPVGEMFKSAFKGGVKQVKKMIRQIMTEKRELDPEEQRMMHRLVGHDGSDNNRPEGVRYIHFTHGPKEEEVFQRQNEYIKEQGLPFFTKYKRGLGFGLNIWMQKSHEAKSFVTHIELAPRSSLDMSIADKGITNMSDLGRPATAEMKARKEMGEQVNYKAMGFEAVDPGEKFKFVVWLKRDKGKIKSIGDIGLSLSVEDENVLMDDGFKKYEKCLDEFDMPESYIWFKHVDKIITNQHSTTGAVINEMVKTKELFIQNPKDKNLKALLERHRQKLEEHYLEEQKNNVTNPIASAIDLMVLSPQDLNRWADHFEEIDVEKEGAITLDSIFTFLRETPTETAIEIFKYSDAIDEEDLIEFGDFMRAVGTYCMFGRDEVLRFLFTFTDKLSEGTITHKEFINLCNLVNPFDKKKVRRALAEMALAPEKTMDIKEFRQINQDFPGIFHPMFKLQHCMRTAFMGENWWVNKLRKYAGVRDRVGGKVDVDALAELEKERFASDVQTRKRMNERKRDIRNEKSTVRKTLLEAKQFLDDLSLKTGAI